MGNLILCHDRHAAHPYEISRIHCRIFTIEELCYYLCNNLYLIDYTIMNEPLCTWLEEEIGMKELAEQLRDLMRMRGSVENIPAIQTRSIQRSESIFKEICSGVVEMVYNRGAGCVNIRLLAYQISYKKDMI